METAGHLIDKILKAARLYDVVSQANCKEEYRKCLLVIHPDVCTLPGAGQATAKLNKLKEDLERGQQLSDEAGSLCTNGYKSVFDGDRLLLLRSVENYKQLRSVGSPHFHKYLPACIQWEGTKLVADHEHRAIPLSDLHLPQEHVNWVLSRLLEFCAQIHQYGYVHTGLCPESVFIVPETHGIQVVSFYHMKPEGNRITTINAQYKNWYPASLFNEKKARSVIDIELAKKNAIRLLGDPSGSGIKLRKTHNASFLDFVISQSTDPVDTYYQYRAILKSQFKNRFHILHL